MDGVRGHYQGVWNIVRFNWHYYILSVIITCLFFLIQSYFSFSIRLLLGIFLILTIFTTVISLLVSWYIYDHSDLYKFEWLINLRDSSKGLIINIHAGFDETSKLLERKYGNSELLIMDFYDPALHTEVSIKRARQHYPPHPANLQISTSHIPLEDNFVNKVFATLSAHEIRSSEERIIFFKEVARVLHTSGQVIVTERLRDVSNFFAYNIGFFHFHSRATWLNTFSSSGLVVNKEIKITPFITTFILEKNGATY